MFQVCKDEELSPGELFGVLSFLMDFDIHIANNWQSNIDSEIKQIRSVPGRRQSLFFLCQGSTWSNCVCLQVTSLKYTFSVTIIDF